MARTLARVAAPILLSLLAGPLAGQGAPAAPSTTAAPAPTATPAVQTSVPVSRAGWFTDKRPLRVGDIVTILVDEAVNSTERQTENASKNRSQQMGLNLNVGTAVKIGPQKGFESGVNNGSTSSGEANRAGGLSATISVRVVSIEPSGIAHLKGTKTVGVDGRNQVIQLEGVVRPEDLGSDNTVLSSRIAESVISYKGKKIGPAKGILGSILSIFWP
jgi:flagellar L-ring protein FlgH